jgi:cytochrome c-type biogenesis protein CcmH/NrfG
MSRFDNRSLPASIFIVALAGTCSLAMCQSAAPPLPLVIAPQSIQNAAAIPQNAVAPEPKPQPTPEQLGDALMAHQRYQAAIEAYKKAPRTEPAVWNKLGIAYQLMFDLTDAMQS